MLDRFVVFITLTEKSSMVTHVSKSSHDLISGLITSLGAVKGSRFDYTFLVKSS